MIWRVRLTEAAKRQMRRVWKENPYLAEQIAEAIVDLESDPSPGESGKLRKSRDAYKLVIPPYRVLYAVYKDGLVKVIRVELRTGRTYRVRNP